MNVNDLLNGGCLQASFDDTLIHTSSEPLGVIPELYTSVPAPDDPINSVESPIAIDHSFDYMPPLLYRYQRYQSPSLDVSGVLITFDFREGFTIKSNTTKTWALITEEFQKQTGSGIKSIRKPVEKELDERRDELKEQEGETGTVQNASDKQEICDKIIEFLDDQNVMRELTRKTIEEQQDEKRRVGENRDNILMRTKSKRKAMGFNDDFSDEDLQDDSDPFETEPETTETEGTATPAPAPIATSFTPSRRLATPKGRKEIPSKRRRAEREASMTIKVQSDRDSFTMQDMRELMSIPISIAGLSTEASAPPPPPTPPRKRDSSPGTKQFQAQVLKALSDLRGQQIRTNNDLALLAGDIDVLHKANSTQKYSRLEFLGMNENNTGTWPYNFSDYEDFIPEDSTELD
ncbi:hypothetical protein BGZ57DRAFT_854512 [Hyaloscypha finlandica]|nr:hypothetical protein BGZ57DRAFT_854512 [Hyaloscypha finlandica]